MRFLREITSMSRSKGYSWEEIAAMLEQARFMAEQGLRQADICRSLGISVMTFHRWRKTAKPVASFEMSSGSDGAGSPAQHSRKSIADLQLENQRLRRLV